MFLLIMYSSFLYPVEFQENVLYDIAAATNLDVQSFGLERDIELHLHFYFFHVDLEYNHLTFQLFLFELVFMADIIINLFVIREEDLKKHDRLKITYAITSQSYLNDGFWFDFLVWFPWGPLLAEMISDDFYILNFIKCARLVVVQSYLNDAILKEFFTKLFDLRFQSILADPILREDINNNRTLIETRILVNNIVIALKIIFLTMLILFFTGNYW